ncbi:MAG: hypothetical protein OEQ16_15195 [Gammaproteobacteria bacterium]|jgi:hypothetical protein|nr:hypothetical protein [Gammaproteobacteria bacterium]MDH3984074.1 hypothetical protein [Gammaproteobacteria bacterium]
MSSVRLTILALFLSSVCISPAIGDNNVVIAAQETEANVAPRAKSLRLINLPALTFSLRAAIRCQGEATSLTLSIADTFRTLGKDELAGQRAADTSLTVPAQQLALAATSRFCIDGDTETSDKLLVSGVTTAHASLVCASDTNTSVHYASTPLQISLTCDRGPEKNQEPSSER